MKRLLLSILLIFYANCSANAKQDTDFPHRDWGKIAIVDMDFIEAQACIARTMDKIGSVLVLPVDGGSDIDFTFSGGLFTQTMGEPYLRFKLRRQQSSITLEAFYRHPLSAKSIDGMFKSLRSRCLRLVSISDRSPDRSESSKS